MTELTINQAVGRVLPISSLKTGEAYPAVCVSFLTALDVEERGCRIVDISGLESAVSSPNVKLVSLNLKPGSVIPKLDYSGARFGAVLSTGETPDEARSRAQNAKSKIRISLDSQ
jgi:formate-dependent phosphoribosylglycinamide formyltransferase (GAR transformylase)